MERLELHLSSEFTGPPVIFRGTDAANSNGLSAVLDGSARMERSREGPTVKFSLI